MALKNVDSSGRLPSITHAITAVDGSEFRVTIHAPKANFSLAKVKVTFDEERAYPVHLNIPFEDFPGISYYATSLLARPKNQGLILHHGMPSWLIGGETMDTVLDWINEFVVVNSI